MTLHIQPVRPPHLAHEPFAATSLEGLRKERSSLISRLAQLDLEISHRELEARAQGQRLLDSVSAMPPHWRDLPDPCDVPDAPEPHEQEQPLTLGYAGPQALPAPQEEAPVEAVPAGAGGNIDFGGRPLASTLSAESWLKLLESPAGILDVALTYSMNAETAASLRNRALQGRLPISRRHEELYRLLKAGHAPDEIAKLLKASLGWVYHYNNLYNALLTARRRKLALPETAWKPLDIV